MALIYITIHIYRHIYTSKKKKNLEHTEKIISAIHTFIKTVAGKVKGNMANVSQENNPKLF